MVGGGRANLPMAIAIDLTNYVYLPRGCHHSPYPKAKNYPTQAPVPKTPFPSRPIMLSLPTSLDPQANSSKSRVSVPDTSSSTVSSPPLPPLPPLRLNRCRFLLILLTGVERAEPLAARSLPDSVSLTGYTKKLLLPSPPATYNSQGQKNSSGGGKTDITRFQHPRPNPAPSPFTCSFSFSSLKYALPSFPSTFNLCSLVFYS